MHLRHDTSQLCTVMHLTYRPSAEVVSGETEPMHRHYSEELGSASATYRSLYRRRFGAALYV